MTDDDYMVLSEDQAAALEAAGRWVDEARAAVGDAFLRLKETQLMVQAAEELLAKATSQALRQEMSHRMVMGTISKALNLPPGEWRYDAAKMRLIRKAASDA